MNTNRCFHYPKQTLFLTIAGSLKYLIAISFLIVVTSPILAQTHHNLEGKTAVKLVNQQDAYQLLLGYTKGQLKLLPNDGHAQAHAAKLDFQPVNYRNKDAGVYIFLHATEEVLVRSFEGQIQLKKFSGLSACDLEFARWDYSIMMTGGADEVYYQFHSKSTTEPERWLIADKNKKLFVTTERGKEGSLWIAKEVKKENVKRQMKRN